MAGRPRAKLGMRCLVDLEARGSMTNEHCAMPVIMVYDGHGSGPVPTEVLAIQDLAGDPPVNVWGQPVGD